MALTRIVEDVGDGELGGGSRRSRRRHRRWRSGARNARGAPSPRGSCSRSARHTRVRHRRLGSSRRLDRVGSMEGDPADAGGRLEQLQPSPGLRVGPGVESGPHTLVDALGVHRGAERSPLWRPSGPSSCTAGRSPGRRREASARSRWTRPTPASHGRRRRRRRGRRRAPRARPPAPAGSPPARPLAHGARSRARGHSASWP